MAPTCPQEFVVNRVVVRVYASMVELPGATGWVGVWSIYRIPRGVLPPVRIGDTSIETSETRAIDLAKGEAMEVAMSL